MAIIRKLSEEEMEEMTLLDIGKIALVSGIFWLLIFWFFSRVFRRKKRPQPLRKVEFTLPDRENTFVRARLSTALNLAFCEEETREERIAIEFSQALEMLKKIKIAPLSPAETIELGQMQSDFSAYQKRETFSAKEVAAINEKFARLLKLVAKYAV